MEEELKDFVLSLESEYGAYDHSAYLSERGAKCIYKFPYELKIKNDDSEFPTTPLVASFGPYHHGKPHLQPMEQHKKRALYRILNRANLQSPVRFLQSLRTQQQALKDSYDNLDPGLSSDSFIKMMLLDGCFMLELLRFQPGDFDGADPIFSEHGTSHMFCLLHDDILLLENQIPLLALKTLLDAEAGNVNEDHNDEIIKLIIKFTGSYISSDPPFRGLHVLDVYRKCLIWKPSQEASTEGTARATSRSPCLSMLRILGNCLGYLIRGIPCCATKLRFIRSAKQFHDLGVNFKRSENVGLSIEFDQENGVLTLPMIMLEDNSGSLYRNLMAFERMHPGAGNEISSFISFMDDLVDTAEDVRVMRLEGVLHHILESDEDAALVFNSLGRGIIVRVDDENGEVYKQLVAYAATSWHAWRANLVHTYFNNPWTCLSLFAAILLLILTVIQTIYAVLAYRKSP